VATVIPHWRNDAWLELGELVSQLNTCGMLEKLPFGNTFLGKSKFWKYVVLGKMAFGNIFFWEKRSLGKMDWET